jgi:hypothetical protein
MSAEAEWYFVGAVPAMSQGWKLYISANGDNFAAVLAAVRPVIASYGQPFKYVADTATLWRLNAGMAGYSQIGKSIVVYICDEAQAAALTAALKLALAPFKASSLQPPYAHPIGGGYPLSFRFGAFSGKEIALGGETLQDERSSRQDLSRLPACPFTFVLEPQAKDEGLNRFLLSYPVFSVLGQAGKGGVFAALDLASPEYREVIIKLGRRHGSPLPDGRDGMDLARHEHWFYTIARETCLTALIPALVNFAEFASAAALVLERVEGVTLLGLHMDGTLAPHHLGQALEILNAFHACGYLVGDAKLANFIATPCGAMKAIDFESAGAVDGARDTPQHASFVFTDEGLANQPCAYEKLHFLYSVIHISHDEGHCDPDRVVCLQAVLADQRALPPIADHARDLARRIYAAGN